MKYRNRQDSVALALYPLPFNHHKYLASVQHAAEGGLLCSSDSQLVVALDLGPGLSVGAVEAGQHGLPLIGAGVTLGAVLVGRDSPELRSGNIVGQSLALSSGPFGGTRLNVMSA